MTKRDMVEKIAKETKIPQNIVATVFQHTLDQIAEELSKGNTVELRNFGVFEVTTRKARVGRNPNKPKVNVIIPERTVIKFKTGKELKQQIKKINPKTVK